MFASKKLALIAIAVVALTCSPVALASQADTAPAPRRLLRSEADSRVLTSMETAGASTAVEESASLDDSSESETRSSKDKKEKKAAKKEKKKAKKAAKKEKKKAKKAEKKEKKKAKEQAGAGETPSAGGGAEPGAEPSVDGSVVDNANADPSAAPDAAAATEPQAVRD